RYAIDLREFSGAILKQWWRLRRRRKQSTNREILPVQTWQDCKVIRLPARLDTEAVNHHRETWESAISSAHSCVLDLSGIEFIDSTGIGFLIRFQKRTMAAGQKVFL